MKRLFYSILIALILIINYEEPLRAQVTFSFNQPPADHLYIESMWNIIITNSTSQVKEVYLLGQFTDGDKIAEGTSASFEVGAFYSGPVTSFELMPVDVKYYGDNYYKDYIEMTGEFPNGNYTICVSVLESGTDQLLYEQCFDHQVFISTDPYLISPVDGARTLDIYPVFTWSMPSPGRTDAVSYSAKIVQLYDSQQLYEAIESNPAWFEEKDIYTTSFQYPINARELESGAMYAWQVTSYVNGQQTGSSEVMSFRCDRDLPPPEYDTHYIRKADSISGVGGEYHYTLVIRNVSSFPVGVTITSISKTDPPTQAIVKQDVVPVVIDSWATGKISGIIYSKSDHLKEVTFSLRQDDQKFPDWNFTVSEVTVQLAEPYSALDFGDAPSPFRSLKQDDGARHDNTIFYTNNNVHSGLGSMPLYNNNGLPDCNQACSGVSADYEADAILSGDAKDDGIKFLSPLSQYCIPCSYDSIDVTINISPAYNRSIPLLLHAWFDFDRDQDWDGGTSCPGNTNPLDYNEHIYWLFAKLLCPVNPNYLDQDDISNQKKLTSYNLNLNQKYAVNDQEFLIDPGTWGKATCATYRLYFHSGSGPSSQPQGVAIWTRFRLTPKQGNYANAGSYTGIVDFGEVEDYVINCYPPNEYDYGDAPDELNDPDLHYCTHILAIPASNCNVETRKRYHNFTGILPTPWSNYKAAVHQNFTQEWLGKINPPSPCGVSTTGECNGQTINNDQLDDGVTFTGFDFPFSTCDTQKVQVMVGVANFTPYSQSTDAMLHLHAWFDWNQDGDWDDTTICDQNRIGPGNDHVFWLTAKPIFPTATVIQVNSYDFAINPNNALHWPDLASTCQAYELTFISGQNANGGQVTDNLWARFRLYYGNDGVNGRYYDETKRGEVEDYPIGNSCGAFIDNRDGKMYNAVQIGTQCWMAQNLDYSEVLPFLPVSMLQRDNPGGNVVEKYCFGDLQIHCDNYGGLYTWAEAMAYVNGVNNDYPTGTLPYIPTPPGNIRGICPQGWHLPSDQEWCTMENYIASVLIEPPLDCTIPDWTRGVNIGAALKEPGTIYWTSVPAYNPNNSSGFSARGGGVVEHGGSCIELKDHGHWWTTLQLGAGDACVRHLFHQNNFSGRGGGGTTKTNAHSVRCIRD